MHVCTPVSILTFMYLYMDVILQRSKRSYIYINIGVHTNAKEQLFKHKNVYKHINETFKTYAVHACNIFLKFLHVCIASTSPQQRVFILQAFRLSSRTLQHCKRCERCDASPILRTSPYQRCERSRLPSRRRCNRHERLCNRSRKPCHELRNNFFQHDSKYGYTQPRQISKTPTSTSIPPSRTLSCSARYWLDNCNNWLVQLA